MKQILIGCGFVLMVVAVLWIYRAELGELLFEWNVAELGTDQSEDLPDGLHVFVCGAGSPLPDPKRGGPCIGVIAGEDAFIFDTGSGSSRVLSRMGFPYAAIQRIFITHYHSDHIDGLGALVLQTWIVGGRTTPIQVVGPVGLASVVEGFNRAYSLDSKYRLAHHGPEVANIEGSGAISVEFEFDEEFKTLFEKDELKITAFEVDHRPVMPAVGYRIDYRGRSIAITGDTTAEWNAAGVAEGVDILIHEALNHKMVSMMREAVSARGLHHVAKIFEDIPGYHASPVEAAKAAAKANARELLLYHIIPPLRSVVLNSAFIKGVDEHYAGKVTIAEDGMVISLPTGSTSIIHR